MTIVPATLNVLLLAACVPLAAALGVFVLQVLFALPARRRPPAAATATAAAARPRLAVLVPAHDEEVGIGATLARLLRQLRAGDRLLVVADNCADQTADIARAAGATVVERTHATLRGKGFALAFGIDALRADPPELVVIVDADCDVEDGALDALAACTAATGRPAQARYLMQHRADANLSQRLAQFAWRVRNWTRPAGWQRLGGPCQLMGSGMCFRWDALRDAPLANASIVEDMKLGIDLALQGQAPVFCDEALVTSLFPDAAAATRTQRTRWEHGHLEMIVHEALPLLARGLRRGDRRVVLMALDLCVPPLALLAALLFAVLAASAVLAALSPAIAAARVAGTLALAFLGAVLTAWAAFGRDLVSATELAAIPLYVVRKLPIYVRFLTGRQRHWVRTGRDPS